MFVDMVEDWKRVDNELSGTELVGAQYDSRCVSAFGRVAGRECGGEHLSWSVLPIKQMMRSYRPVVVPIQHSLVLQPFEDTMWLGDTLFVVEPVIELVDTALVCQREPIRLLLVALECVMREKYDRTACRHAFRQSSPFACVRRSARNISNQDYFAATGTCGAKRCDRSAVCVQPRFHIVGNTPGKNF